MHQPYVLIHQARPSHQILLHQALNAQGVFNVRISANAADLDACLNAERRPDLLILDHAMPTRAGLAVLARQHQSRALLFVGQATPKHQNLAKAARSQGLWVLAELALAAVDAALAACPANIAGAPGAPYSNCHVSPACSLKQARFDELSAAPAGQFLYIP